MEKEIRTFHLDFNETQLNLLVAGLHKLPGSLCMPLLGSIRNQIEHQTQLNKKSGKKNNILNG